ncbi:rib/alpha/Esp surface antigen [Propionimicrobium lymphophilum ACS-093-V-SCH5]|uniref:Rib/alpha/Esp surface antigen n=1 Tax=Propionimicrobium lymphophilum ACS-093-V-SCH5 TaxID=883161 RepID=S2W1C0_9ACTN|nr:Rib/alpha-like domain-containing protein [Propionimicrobium lymphophilum]EPD32946.1 rib/alpha/Esp surface antigen [Propionimicrobium lymphophilum ACS-093-V-SCH5]
MRTRKLLAGVSMMIAAGLLAPVQAFAADKVIPDSDLPKWPKQVQVPCGILPPTPKLPELPDGAADKYMIQATDMDTPMTMPTMYQLYSDYPRASGSLSVELTANDGYVFENGKKTTGWAPDLSVTRCSIPKIETAYLNVGDDVKDYNFAQHVLGEGDRKVITHSTELYFSTDHKNVVERPDTSKPGRYRVWLRVNYADGGTDKVVVPVVVTEKGQKPGPFWPDVLASGGVHNIHLANQGGKVPEGISLAPSDGIKARIVDGGVIEITDIEGSYRSGSIDIKNVAGEVIDTIVVSVSHERDDNDNDGIDDRSDKCAQTPKLATVDVSGCPVFAPTATPKPGGEADAPESTAKPDQPAQVAPTTSPDPDLNPKPVPATKTPVAISKPGVPETGGSGFGFVLATAAVGGLAVGVSRFRNRESK